jgi:hemolysin activation/secretion protein
MGKTTQSAFALIILSGSCFLSNLGAQDFEKVQPKTPAVEEKQGYIPAQPVARPGGREILVKELKGVVFVDDNSKVQTPPPPVKGIKTNGIKLLEDKRFPRVIEPYLHKPVSMDSLNAMVKDIVLYCREMDRPVVDVIVPEQDITGGIIQLILLEAKVGQVRAEGNRWFASRNLAGEIRLEHGDPISARKLLKDVSWINQNPFRTADIVFTPGKKAGETDIVVKTQDRFPVRFYAGYEDSGNDLTGDERGFVGMNWGDAFFLGHQMNYQFTASPDFKEFTAHSGSYLIPLPWRHTLTFFGAVSSSGAQIPNFNLNGAGAQLGGRYTIPLPDITSHYTQEMFLGYDWKQSDNSLEFGSITASASTTDIGQFVFGYRGQIKDPWGSLSFSPQVCWSPVGVWDFQNDTAYTGTRAGASPDYVYFKIDVSRVTRLPWEFSLVNELTWQVADTNLLPSEQLAFGGYSSIRGYDEREITNTDEGWILRNELRTPPVSLLRVFKCDRLQDQLQFLFFFDYGIAEAYDGAITLNNGKAEAQVEMGSVGPGIRYTVNQYLSVRADYGFQLFDTGNARNSSRWHLGIIFSY